MSDHSAVGSAEQQKQLYGEDGDYLIVARRGDLKRLDARAAKSGALLRPGDTLKIADLTVLPVSTTSIIRWIARIMRQGVTLRLCAANIEFKPDELTESHALFLQALHKHWRFTHGTKTGGAKDIKAGRKALLTPDQYPEIERALSKPGATPTSVAKDFGVGRTTLFSFLKLHRESKSKL